MSKHKFLILLAFLIIIPNIVGATPSCRTLLNDIEVLYLYEEPTMIDWPLLYHLGIEKSCRVNMVSVEAGPAFKYSFKAPVDENIYSYRFYMPDYSGYYLDSILSSLNSWRLPDIVIFAEDFRHKPTQVFEQHLFNYHQDNGRVFNIRKYLRHSSGIEGDIYINNALYMSRYYNHLKELAEAFSAHLQDFNNEGIYSSYSIVQSTDPGEMNKASILAGVEENRMYRLVEKYVENFMVQAAMKKAIEQYLQNVDQSIGADGIDKINYVADALESLYRIKAEYYADIASDSLSVIGKYLSHKTELVSKMIFELGGIDFENKTVLRDSPEGLKLKLITKIYNNGPLNIQAGQISVEPGWTGTVIEFPVKEKEIRPFNSLVREFVLDIDPTTLASSELNSLLVSGRIRYRGRNIDYNRHADAYIETPLAVALVPDFALIKPFPELQVDRIVEPVRMKAVITKPSYKAVDAKIKVIAPPGTMAGAYRQEISMAAGTRSSEISIPLVATKNLTPGRKLLVVNIIENNYIIASDTAFVALAESKIDAGLKIALLAGSDGMLEDILSSSNANYRTISNRYLETEELDQYDIVALETGCFKNYKSLATVEGKLRAFMDRGGTILVFGQPDDWPSDLLPVTIVSTEKLLPGSTLHIKDGNHPILVKTRASQFLEGVKSRYWSYPAIVSPSESIIVTDDMASVLAESKFNKGRLIYCGLPLLDMFHNLDVVAISFFTGLINYSGK